MNGLLTLKEPFAELMNETFAHRCYCQAMAEPSPLEQIPPENLEPLDSAERERRLAQAEASIEAGKGVSHERVRTWLLDLAANRRTPPPACG